LKDILIQLVNAHRIFRRAIASMSSVFGNQFVNQNFKEVFS
jgi:hypothetical protein